MATPARLQLPVGPSRPQPHSVTRPALAGSVQLILSQHEIMGPGSTQCILYRGNGINLHNVAGIENRPCMLKIKFTSAHGQPQSQGSTPASVTIVHIEGPHSPIEASGLEAL